MGKDYKKYVFLLKRATKSEVEIKAENKNEAFNILMNLVTKEDKKVFNEIDPDKQILRIKLKEIIEENENGIENSTTQLKNLGKALPKE